MSIPLAVRCIKCGTFVGAVIAPAEDRLTPLQLEFACMNCVNSAAEKTGVVPSSEDNWRVVIAELKS
jgi:hypothetical protein